MSIKDVDFKNEQALKFVTTYDKQWSDFQLEISAYANYIFNYIYLKPTGVTRDLRGVYPYLRYTQTDALFIGLDVSGTLNLGPNIRMQPKVSLIRASDERNHDYLIYIPSNRYELSMRYEEPSKFALSDFLVELKGRYVARQSRAPRVLTVGSIIEAFDRNENIFEHDPSNFDFVAPPDGYFLLSLSSGFSLHSGKSRYDFRVAAENILNSSYREYTNRFRYYADDPGRNFILSVKHSF
jgi:iron complex outermembrane receptor protein